jgi:hypothetical protein
VKLPRRLEPLRRRPVLANQMRTMWTMSAPAETPRRCPADTVVATRTSRTKKPYANMLRRFRSSWPVHRAAPRSPRSRETNLLPIRLCAAVFLLALAPVCAFGATPSPQPSAAKKPPAHRLIDVTKIQPKSLLPKRPEHQEYVVEINKYGQVARVRSERGNGDPTFNAQTYGNALQAFIRTPDGHVVVGTYRLTYDFDPKTARVRRDVTLLRQGGVDPDAQGAVADMLSKVHPHTPPPIAPGAGSAIDPRALPDLNRLSPPTASPSPQ